MKERETLKKHSSKIEKFREKLNISKGINDDQRQIIEKLVMKYESIFEYDGEKIG